MGKLSIEKIIANLTSKELDELYQDLCKKEKGNKTYVEWEALIVMIELEKKFRGE